MKRDLTPLISGLCGSLFVGLLFLMFDYVENQRYQEVLHVQSINQLSQVRVRLEAQINANFYLTRGLIAFVETHPSLNQETFHKIAANLLRQHSFIKTIALAPNNIIEFMHPIEGNEKAIGLDYQLNESQWPAIKIAIDSKKTVVAGPVNLVQGGSAFISRTPIYIDSENLNQNDHYWGLASIVIDKEQLFNSAGFYNQDLDISVAAKGTDGLGAQGGFIAGDEKVFLDNPVVLDVHLPEGRWQLAAVPIKGWNQTSPYRIWIFAGGVVFSLLTGFGVFIWLRGLTRAQRKLEEAHEKAILATQALQDNENFLNAIIENIPDMVFVKEAQDLKFVRFNKAAESITGYSKQDVLGKNDYDLFPKDQADFFTDIDKDVLFKGKLVTLPAEPVQTVHQGKRILHTKKIPILGSDNSAQYLLGISEDITDRIMAEEEKKSLGLQLQQAQKMEAIGLMAGGVAHDLNNLLAAITGYPELLLRRLPEDSELRQPLNIMMDTGKRATAIVADLLTVARGVASYKQIASLNTLINEYLNSPECASIRDLHSDINIHTQLDPKLKPTIVSSVHIKKCLMNLVNNAAEAIHGKGSIVFKTWNESVTQQKNGEGYVPFGNYVVLSIQDSGEGISSNDIEHIFEPFYTKKIMGKSGTGLGLAVVWNTMQDHHGKILVQSDTRGTLFKLYFPECEKVVNAPVENNETETWTGNGEHVLIVDDELHMRDIASQMLQAQGYRVSDIFSGEAAIQFVEKTPVDLVVIDMQMGPGINGRQTYEALIKFHPNQKAIIVSGFSESEEVKIALNTGAAAFLQKPYTAQQLCRVVKEALQSQDGI